MSRQGTAKVFKSWLALSCPKVTQTEKYSLYAQARCFSGQPPQKNPSFIGKVIDNLRDEMERDKILKKRIKDFKQDMDSLEKSDALKEARRTYDIIQNETVDGTEKVKQQLQQAGKKVLEEAQKTEILKKASKATEEATKQAQKVGQTIAAKGEQLAKTQTYKTIQDTAKIVKSEIDETTLGKGCHIYRPPTVLRRRTEVDPNAKNIDANDTATDVTLHKDSKFSQSWQEFKDKNPYVGKVLEWRTKLDESNNPVVRASIFIKEKTTEILGGLFERNKTSEALTEICKIDPSFDKEEFLVRMEEEIIPNVLEAMIRPDLEILEDWCFEKTFQQLAAPAKYAMKEGLIFDSKVLDVDHVEFMVGDVMDEGPIIAVSFQTQQLFCVRRQNGDVAEGDPNKVMRVNYVWVMCRDQTEYLPSSAWRLLDISAQSSEQLL